MSWTWAAWWLIAFPVATLRVVARHADHFPPLYLHMLGGTIMLTCGAANLYIGATRHFFAWHRLIGQTYLIGGGVGALVAFALAVGPAHPLAGGEPFTLAAVTNVGISIGTLAVAWMLASAMAYRAIRNRRIATHRDWMIRSYALVWSFVFCRLASRVPAIGDLGGGEAFCLAVVGWPAGTMRGRAAMEAGERGEELAALGAVRRTLVATVAPVSR